MSKERPKVEDLMAELREHAESGSIIYSAHAIERQEERRIIHPDVLAIFHNGWWEKRKDEWQQEYEAWNYAVRGKTIDDSKARIVVSLEEDVVLVVTVIALEKDE